MEICKRNETLNASSCGSGAMILECYIVLSSPYQKTFIAALCGLVGSLCVLENFLVLYLIFSSPRIRRKPSYLFLSSLALADMLASMIFTCSFVEFHAFQRINPSKDIFLLKLGGVNASFTASLGSLLLMAADRYICILKPSKYKVLVTSRRALVALVVLWGTTISIAALPLLGWNCCSLGSACSELYPFVDNKYLSSWIALVMVLLVSIFYSYMHVLWKARKHALYMKRHHSQVGQQSTRIRIDIALAKTLVIVLVVLVICWSPALALMTYSVFAELDESVKKAFAFCCTLCLVNSMVNPAIYALRSRELCSSLKDACPCFRRTPRSSDSQPEAESTQKTYPPETICTDTVVLQHAGTDRVGSRR
ncbi:cannabinoid receptor 2 [Tiliqua scincoides]|uniref:cannabinoid receptor 2 n=1 Tax=Tiliqua scincoides TaxID=71010 RepID=UPI003462EE6E